MLHLKQPKHLARHLGVTLATLTEVAQNVSSHVEELVLLDPKQPDRPRDVLQAVGQLGMLQHRIYRRLLLPRLKPSAYSHGGIRGRHIMSNVLPHLNASFAFATDISAFYPSIHSNRVYELFVGPLDCAPDVARLLTRLCTHNYHLALGLTTSPIIADQMMSPIDQRISSACSRANLTYTRFVDDITVSGNYELDEENSGISRLIVDILDKNGFRVQARKHRFGALSSGFTITSLRIQRGRLDVSNEYLAELDAQLLDAQRIAVGVAPVGLHHTYAQLCGRVEFASWINRHRRRGLMRTLRSIDWASVQRNATAMGLQSSKKVVLKRATQLPLTVDHPKKQQSERCAVGIGASSHAMLARDAEYEIQGRH